MNIGFVPKPALHAINNRHNVHGSDSWYNILSNTDTHKVAKIFSPARLSDILLVLVKQLELLEAGQCEGATSCTIQAHFDRRIVGTKTTMFRPATILHHVLPAWNTSAWFSKLFQQSHPKSSLGPLMSASFALIGGYAMPERNSGKGVGLLALSIPGYVSNVPPCEASGTVGSF